MTEETPVVGPALQVLNQLVEEDVLQEYVIGGSTALMFYTEPMLTEDMDIFCHISSSSPFDPIGPVSRRLQELGYPWEGQYLRVEGVLVQILLPPGELMEEAMRCAVSREVEGVPTKMLDYEYLLASMCFANRSKDRVKICAAIEVVEPDHAKLEDILARHRLLDRWKTMIR